MFRVEYLTTFAKDDQFCKTGEAFNNLIKTIDGVSLNTKELRLGTLRVRYELQHGEIQTDQQRYFHLKLDEVDEVDIDAFYDLLRSIRTVLTKASGKPPQTLWDGIGFSYAQAAYKPVHELENTLRKLITKFMLINVGVGWTREAIPKEVVESIRTAEGKIDHNYLFQVDFIQLSNFLFKEYPALSTASLLESIRKAKDPTDLDLAQLKQAVPVSNWDKYFSSIVNCESDYLRIRWERLYEKRNQIAHNRPMSVSEYKETLSLCDEIRPKLQEAIDGLDKVTVSDDDRDLVSENAAASKSLTYKEFLQLWKDLQGSLYFLVLNGLENSFDQEKLKGFKSNFRHLLNLATRELNLLTRHERAQLLELFALRNVLLHHADLVVPEEALHQRLGELMNHLRNIETKTMELILNEREVDNSGPSGIEEEQEEDWEV